MYSSDDQVYVDGGWDYRLDEEVAKYPDKIYCVWFNDGWEAENFCTFPIVSSQWIETLGYFMFPFFEHFFIDSWIWLLAKSLDRAIYIPEILVEHRHWKIGKSEKDDTYERNATSLGDDRHARDRAIIDKFERYFYADVELLKSLMRQDHTNLYTLSNLTRLNREPQEIQLSDKGPRVINDPINSLHETFREALKYQRDGQLDLAVKFYKLFLSSVPDQTDALNNLGVCLIELDRPHEATNILLEALELSLIHI